MPKIIHKQKAEELSNSRKGESGDKETLKEKDHHTSVAQSHFSTYLIKKREEEK